LFIVGVAGSGKTKLITNIILMAMFGENDKEHPQQILYMVNHNAAVRDFAVELEEMAAMGKHDHIIRNYRIETEINDWLVTVANVPRRRDKFDRESVERACITEADLVTLARSGASRPFRIQPTVRIITAVLRLESPRLALAQSSASPPPRGIRRYHFLAESQLALLSVGANDARAKARNPKVPALSIHQAMFKYYSASHDIPIANEALCWLLDEAPPPRDPTPPLDPGRPLSRKEQLKLKRQLKRQLETTSNT
jgi:hypothetical protein